MKLTNILFATFLTTSLMPTVQTRAVSFDLGAAGPSNFSVLEIGTGAPNANVSIANAANAGFITGNVGVLSTGNVSDSGVPITGNVYLGSGASLNPNVAPNVSGSVSQNAASQTLLALAANNAVAASMTASAQAASGGGVGVTTINTSTSETLTSGIYNLTDLKLGNGAILTLAAGGKYIFNISGTLSLNSAMILTAAGLSSSDVLFNVTSSQGVAFSGGLNNESVLDGIILAPDASISLTPGAVNGEIIGGGNINIASGGSVQGSPSSVPDSGSSLLLMSIGLVSLGLLKMKISSPQTAKA